MALDQGPLAEHAAFVMDEIEKDYGEDAELVDAVLTVEVRTEDMSGDPVQTVQVFHMNGRTSTAIGMLTMGLEALMTPQD